MIDRRPRRLWLPLGLLLLPLGVRAAPAQTETPAEAPQLTPSEVYRDVKLLQVVDQLQLTRAQIEKMVPIAQKVSDQAAADRAADDAAYKDVGPAAQIVIQALTKGVDPPRDALAALDQAAKARNAREDTRAGLAAAAAAEILRTLTAQQVSRIETAAEQANRRALQARLEGAATPLDYLMQKLQEQTELMPDEYLRTREQRALSTAEALLGENAAGVRPLATRLLNIMDQIARMTPEHYQRARATLPQDVAKLLGLPPPPETPPITYDDFIAWLASDRTSVVLQAALNARPQAEGVQP
jgi:hypothetical protein